MEKEFTRGGMAENMTATTSMIRSKGMERIGLQMEGFILASGKMGSSTEKGSSSWPISRRGRVSGRMVIIKSGIMKMKYDF